MSIKSFNCDETQGLFETGKTRQFTNIKAVAERKLQMLDSAVTLESLKAPPGNRLEALARNRVGQHSIRVNDQWRVCFVWTDEGPANVEIVDYH
jgi:proteic killer suppression protein